MSTEVKHNHGSERRILWRSLEHKAAQSDRARDSLAVESAGSDIVNQTIDAGDLLKLNRRKFMTLTGAMGALAGVEGCIRRPAEKILPYVSQPEYASPGAPLHYATVTSRRGESMGLLVTANDGRPTKVEGNPEHPANGGGTDMAAQASVLDLYDADRLRGPKRTGADEGWEAVDSLLAGLAGQGGAGLAVLSAPTNSPTTLRLRAEAMALLPQAKFYSYESLARDEERAGAAMAFGRPVEVIRDFAKAKRVIALDSDFMLTEAGAVGAAAGFAQARDMESAEDDMNRLYSVEPCFSLTGSNADHRLRLAAQEVATFASALGAQLNKRGLACPGSAKKAPQGVDPATWKEWTEEVAADLIAHKGECLVVVGERQPAAVHALGHAMNQALGNVGSTIRYFPLMDAASLGQVESLGQLTVSLNAGAVDKLLILGGNPVFDSPADLGFKEAVGKASTAIHVTSSMNETSTACTWQIPAAHELEAWGDQLSLVGHYSVQQPLIEPLWYGRSDLEIFASLAGRAGTKALDLVRETVEARGFVGEHAWRKLVHSGVSVAEGGSLEVTVRAGAVASGLKSLPKPTILGTGSLEVVFTPDNKILDGRYANNSWLLELPDPMTRITWDNAALIAPATADALDLQSGDMIRISVAGRSLDIAAWRQPGQAPNSLGLPLGWGRSVVGSGGYGYGSEAQDLPRRGFDVQQLRTSGNFGFSTGATVEKLGTTYQLSQTQDHDMMRDPDVEDTDRPLAVDATLAEYREQPNFGQFASPDPSVPPLWETVDYSKGVQWGMVIDLNLCNGCGTCAIACQAENNVPVVGKDQVARGREMHWFRIDRYFVGDDRDDPQVAFQAIGCQHCEEAPCENVCPVAATAHSDEGLNDIAYNRCIGTRYCMNNCPYKVRRFNFLNFNNDIPDTVAMQRNPQVTNRFRGVIEKCTYCVQRIQNGKISARREERELRDGDVKSACQQACPTGGIAFGNINDPDSEVAKKRAVDREYGILVELGVRPRTRFLGKIRNPNMEMKA